MLLALATACSRQAPEHEVVLADHGFVRIQLPQISDRQAHFFTYKHQGKNVNFFVRTDREGTLRAHFDACYSCFKYKRGYVQEGRDVVCIACRIKYDLDSPIWEFVGACVPITLKCRTRESYVEVPVEAVEKGARFF